MRSSVALLLILLLPTPARGNPADEQERALFARITALLAAESQRERAWGAYLAATYRVEAAVPRLLELLREHADDEGPEGMVLRSALLDGLIRNAGHHPLAALEPLIRGHADALLVLVAGRGPVAEALIRPLLDREAGLRLGTWRAVRMLLAEWRSPHLAADLLRELRVEARITVVPAGRLGGGAGGAFDRSRNAYELVRNMPDWPPAVRYHLTDLGRPGDALLVASACPMYFRRMESERNGSRGFPSAVLGISRSEFKLRCLAHLMRGDLEKHWGITHEIRKTISFTDSARYVEVAEAWLEDHRSKHRRLVAYLVSAGLLPEEDGTEARVEFDVRVHDLRDEKERTTLPELR